MANKQGRSYHIPKGNPCSVCGRAAFVHYVGHVPDGNGPSGCSCGADAVRHYQKASNRKDHYLIGIDGEGQGRDDHRYTMMCWSNESGTRKGSIEALPGQRLTTQECLDFILATPKNARPFAYAFNYDLTKLLTDVDDPILYLLFRPEMRQRTGDAAKLGPKPVTWKGYRLNLQGSKFTIERGKRRVVVWDTFKFYQSKFTKALKDWSCGTEAELAEMARLKDQRGDFDKLGTEEIREYCFSECRKMALLSRKLIEAHEDAGLTLRSFYGAGSTGGALLKKMGIDKELRTTPEEMKECVASAFFGGRFENSVIGEIPGELWGYDISSAYPYQLWQLPSLDSGKWRLTRNRADLEKSNVHAACVRYTLGEAPRGITWAPFPFRDKKGSIAFPAASGGGWVWLSEYLAGERVFPWVQFQEAWIYEADDVRRPFVDIPHYYRERLRIGKEGAGHVFKLGPNSGYGKLAQSVGGGVPPYQCWIWAGMVTAGCRAQMLDLMGLHRNLENLFMIATDGAYTREKIDPPKPLDTGTNIPVRGKKGEIEYKPLGGWERKIVKNGMFAARPGIYFPMNPTEEQLDEIRARGIGRKSLFANWRATVDAFNAGAEKVQIGSVTRFHGAKSSVHMVDGPNGGVQFWRTPEYGQWSNRPIDMTFDPMPKRAQRRDDGTLSLRIFPHDQTSQPYRKGLVSPEAHWLMAAMAELMEQPDGDDFVDYEEF